MRHAFHAEYILSASFTVLDVIKPKNIFIICHDLRTELFKFYIGDEPHRSARSAPFMRERQM